MKLDTAKLKKHMLRNMPYCIIFIVILQVASRLPLALPLPDIPAAIIATAVSRLMVYFRGKNAKKYRKNIEYGSACLGRIILTGTEIILTVGGLENG